MTSCRNYRPVQIQDELRIRSKSTSINETSGQLAQNTICTYTYISIYLYLICLCKGCDRCTVHSKYTEKKKWGARKRTRQPWDISIMPLKAAAGRGKQTKHKENSASERSRSTKRTGEVGKMRQPGWRLCIIPQNACTYREWQTARRSLRNKLSPALDRRETEGVPDRINNAWTRVKP